MQFLIFSWRCLYYIYSFGYGLITLWPKPWLWDIKHCFYGYPYHPVGNDEWWYYIMSMAFYWSLSFSQFFDVKRKDFWQMFIHHIATLTLMYFSWICNLTRIGSLVLLVHDCADIFLEVTTLILFFFCYFTSSIDYNYLQLCFLFFSRQLKWLNMPTTKRCVTQFLSFLHFYGLPRVMDFIRSGLYTGQNSDHKSQLNVNQTINKLQKKKEETKWI